MSTVKAIALLMGTGAAVGGSLGYLKTKQIERRQREQVRNNLLLALEDLGRERHHNPLEHIIVGYAVAPNGDTTPITY